MRLSRQDGYEDGSKDITVSAGENKTVTLTFKKVEEAEELKDYSAEKSYRAVMEGNSSLGETNKVIIIQDDYGKSQHITIYTEGEEEFEMYLVGGKAKVLADEQWMEIPPEQVQAMSVGYLDLLKGMASNAEESYNIAINNPDFSYEVKRIGRETMNGYPTTKYHMFSKATSEEGEGVEASDTWIINSGPYEGYATCMVINIKFSGEEETMTINITDFGKDMGIKMPY